MGELMFNAHLRIQMSKIETAVALASLALQDFRGLVERDPTASAGS
jgi:hypothetical protein